MAAALSPQNVAAPAADGLAPPAPSPLPPAAAAAAAAPVVEVSVALCDDDYIRGLNLQVAPALSALSTLSALSVLLKPEVRGSNQCFPPSFGVKTARRTCCRSLFSTAAAAERPFQAGRNRLRWRWGMWCCLWTRRGGRRRSADRRWSRRCGWACPHPRTDWRFGPSAARGQSAAHRLSAACRTRTSAPPARTEPAAGFTTRS